MLDFNKNNVDFYLDYINKELYKSKFTLLKSYNYNKIAFINKISRTSYWFPSNSGRKSVEEYSKLKAKKRFLNHSVYNFDGFKFLSTFEIFFNFSFDTNLNKVIESPIFNNYLALLNDHIRRQELKKNVPYVPPFSTTSWKYRYYSDYTSLKYYYNFEAHRNLVRIRKFNFLGVSSWSPLYKKRWLFSFRNMKNFYFKWRKIQGFEFRYFRAPGMSLKYWAKQQLQYNFLNYNSSAFLTDPKASPFFAPSQLPPTGLEFKVLFGSAKYLYLHFAAFYWLMKKSLEFNFISLPSYFSNSYNSNQFSHGVKHKHLKNFFSSTTPKYAHIYYTKLDDELGGWTELRTYFSFFKPSYWNLKKGLDSYPHEFWTWEDVLWWEDPVPLFFSRFVNKRRYEMFQGAGNIESNNFTWFYKTWFHEEIFTELQASYYRTYYNIDYLTPGWRIQTDYPPKRMGHFDPKWHERFNEYVIYPYMNIFYPSTKRYYIDYFKHPDYVDSRSFLVLNFAWKVNTLPLFFYKFRPKFRKIQRSVEKLNNPQDFLRPNFKSFYTKLRFISFFPILLVNKDFNRFFNVYQNNLLFLMNLFTKSKLFPNIDLDCFEYLFFYLNSTIPLNVDKKDFIELFANNKWSSYADLLEFLVEFLFINPSDLVLHKERIIAEYVAFKRFYSFIISECGNVK